VSAMARAVAASLEPSMRISSERYAG
jgi:hypothetical protein